MTPEELQELRDWAARKMGWVDSGHIYYRGQSSPFSKQDWQPDNPATGQIWMLVERMRELGYSFVLDWVTWLKGAEASFIGFDLPDSPEFKKEDPNPCLAILLAARATEDKP